MWDRAHAELVLHEHEVHAWYASLNLSGDRVCDLTHLLSDEERLRGEQYLFGRDSRRFVVGRALLRLILSGYLDTPPESLTFRYEPNGKPALAGRWQGVLEFNLSHSNENALYAVTRGRKIGVDLEYIRPLPDADDIALRCFSKHENAMLAETRSTERLRTFFEFWTRKEAYIKAIGEGLSFPLDQFDVCLTAGEEERMLSIPGAAPGEPRWTLRALAPDPTYAAALVVEGQGWRLACARWPTEWLPRAQHQYESTRPHAR